MSVVALRYRRVCAVVCTILFLIVVLANPRPARAYATEADWMIVALIVGAFSNVYCETPGDPFADAVWGGEGDPPACDPLHYAKTSGQGLNTSTTTWDIVAPVRLTREITLGAIGGTSRSSADWAAVDVNFNSTANLGGILLAYRFSPQMQFVGAATYTSLKTDFSGLGSFGSFNTRVTTFQGRLERSFNMGSYALTPALSIQHARAARDEFRDVVTNGFEPAANINVTRLQGGATVAVPIPVAGCSNPRSGCKQPSVFANAALFYDQISGITVDPTVPSFRTQYVGFSGGGGVSVPVGKHVSVGGSATWFTAGDNSGYALRAFVNFDLFGLLGKPRPAPLLN
jgi:Autotransporter beta-domain